MTTRERLATAAFVSVALHALVMAGAWLPLPRLDDSPPPRLEARLAATPPAALSEPATQPRSTSRPREKRTHVSSAPAASLAPAPLPSSSVTVPPPAAAVEPLVEPDPPREADAAETASPEAPQRLAMVAESSAVAAAVRTLPRRGRIAFNVLYGDSRFSVGKVVQSWQVDADVYKLASEAETSGVVDLFRPQRMRYISQGRVLPQGLRPDNFLVSRTRRGQNEASQARFDWESGQLTYGTARDPKHAPLPAGTQDLMSLLYQFSLAPPAAGRHRLPITTGSRFGFYEIEVAGEESIETPIGTLKALPVKQIVPLGLESVEFWLASEYRYLPVKIRHFDREGNFSGEQVVTEIRISED